MICHLSEVYATAVINVLLRIVATSDMEEATSSNLVTPTINRKTSSSMSWSFSFATRASGCAWAGEAQTEAHLRHIRERVVSKIDDND